MNASTGKTYDLAHLLSRIVFGLSLSLVLPQH